MKGSILVYIDFYVLTDAFRGGNFLMVDYW